MAVIVVQKFPGLLLEKSNTRRDIVEWVFINDYAVMGKKFSGAFCKNLRTCYLLGYFSLNLSWSLSQCSSYCSLPSLNQILLTDISLLANHLKKIIINQKKKQKKVSLDGIKRFSLWIGRDILH